MSVKNSYPLLPEIPYKKTSVPMPVVCVYAKTLNYPLEVIRSAYMIFRIESGNGAKGINNNYASIEGDSGVWSGLDMSHVVGTCIKFDGQQARRHLCFDETGYQLSFNFLCLKVQQRDMYIGAPGVTTIDEVTDVYKKKWAGYPAVASDYALFRSLYKSACTAFAVTGVV